MRQVRLVKAWADLKDLTLVENECLSDDEVEPLRKELEQVALREFEYHRVAVRIERDNLRAAQAQQLLSLAVAKSLLNHAMRRHGGGEGRSLSTVLRDIESQFQERSRITVDVPAAYFRSFTDDLLFNVDCPAVGELGYATVSRVLARSAMDAVARLVDSMKVRRRELSLNTVLARLDREMTFLARRR